MPVLVRFFAYYQIEPHNPPLLQSSVNLFEFLPCGRTAQVECLRVNLPLKLLLIVANNGCFPKGRTTHNNLFFLLLTKT